MTASLRLLSLGAGVQSTALLLLAAEGRIEKPDLAIFSDTGWEPREVYDHLDRLEREVAEPAGIPILRLQYGNLRDDVLGEGRMTGATLPAFTTPMPGADRGGIVKRQCTEAYKIRPIRQYVREALGAPISEKECRFCAGTQKRRVPWLAKRGDHRLYACTPCRASGTRRTVGPAPRGAYAVQQIGISLDEVQRARDVTTGYLHNSYPLLDMSWTRDACTVYLQGMGWGSTPRSACIGCPYKKNSEWRRLRDGSPDEWQDAVAFDRGLREMPARMASGLLHVDAYLHPSLLPLDQAPIDALTPRERGGQQTDLLGMLGEDEARGFSCSPVSCAGDELDIDLDEIEAGDAA